MTTPLDPELARALDEASARAQALHAELLEAYPTLRGNLSIPGMFVGQGLGSFVANGLPDDEIVAHVLTIVGRIRQALGKLNVQDDDATVH